MADFERVRPEACFDKVKTRGRPKLVLNETGKAVIINLSSIMCTDEEIAACLGVTVETLQNKDNNAAFLECKEKGIGNGRKSLRRIQFEIAKKGNATMAIWLGKQWLGQKEKIDDEFGEKSDGGATVNIVLTDTSGEKNDNSL